MLWKGSNRRELRVIFSLQALHIELLHRLISHVEISSVFNLIATFPSSTNGTEDSLRKPLNFTSLSLATIISMFKLRRFSILIYDVIIFTSLCFCHHLNANNFTTSTLHLCSTIVPSHITLEKSLSRLQVYYRYYTRSDVKHKESKQGVATHMLL